MLDTQEDPGVVSPEIRLLYEVVAFAVLDLHSQDEKARKEALLFFTAPSGGWAESRRAYLDALGIDESYLLRQLGLTFDDTPQRPKRRKHPKRRYHQPPKERRPPSIPREVLLEFIAQHDHVTAGDLVEHFSIPIQVAAGRLNSFREAGYVERPSRGIYRISKTPPEPKRTTHRITVAERVLEALRDAEGMTVKELAWHLEANPTTVYEALNRFKKEGRVINEPPKWRINTSTSG